MNVPRATRAWPVLTIVLVAVSSALEFAPALTAALRFEREALQSGELWRFLSGHLVHDSSRLAVIDLAVLLVLGAWWELRSRAAFVAIVLVSAVAASTAVLTLTDLSAYVGSSAISSGLFAAAAIELGLERGGVRRAVCGLALLLFAIKCIAEVRGASYFAVLPEGTRVCAIAHALGGAGGALVALVRSATSQRANLSDRSSARAGRRCC